MSARKVRPLRSKPAVALATEQLAKANLIQKRQALKALVEIQNQDCQESLPRSVRQFNKWLSSSLPDEYRSWEFRANSNDTLKRYEGILLDVIDLVRAVKQASKQPPRTREDRLVRLRDDKALHLTIRNIAERELVLARREVVKEQASLVTLKAQLKSSAAFSAKRIAELEGEIAVLRAENANLIALTRKVTPISRSK